MKYLKSLLLIIYSVLIHYKWLRRSQWPRGRRRRSAAAHLLRLWVWIPPRAWMFVFCDRCVLSGRGVCDELITRPEEFCRLWCVVVCDLEISWMGRHWPIEGCWRQKHERKKEKGSRFGSWQLLVQVFWCYNLISSHFICCRIVNMGIVQYMSMGFYCILSIRSLPDIPYCYSRIRQLAYVWPRSKQRNSSSPPRGFT